MIINSDDYVIKKDHKPIFYNLTGISYQVVELIHELIKIKNENKEIFSNGVTINIPLPYIEYKDWLKHDDKLYSILSKKIMFEMKKNNSYVNNKRNLKFLPITLRNSSYR